MFCGFADTMSYSKPEQMADQQFYVGAEQGGVAALACRVQGSPPPSLSWFRVHSNLLQPVTSPGPAPGPAPPPRVHALAHLLVVEGAGPGDGGQYRCTARNEVGELSVTIHLQVEPPLVVGRTAGHWSHHVCLLSVLFFFNNISKQTEPENLRRK